MLKKTPLSEIHVKLGAKMVEFGGWYMPVQYTNVIDEHTNTRQKVGLFDICHMGEIEISGGNSLKFLQKVLTNDIENLEENKTKYSLMCYENGGCVDDLFVYRLKDKFMLVVNAANIDKDFEWLNKNNKEGVEIKNISNETAKLDIQGPDAEKVLQKLTDYNLSEIKRFYCKNILLNNIPVLISRTGYTAEDGFEIYFNKWKAIEMWNKILEAGKEFGIKPIGLGARDTLRLEACYSLNDHEIDKSLTPIEAGIGFAVKFNKDFIGKEILKKQAEGGTEKKLFCFEMIDRGIPREHYKIFDKEEIGFVTSGTFSPTFKKGIGMCYIESGLKKIGDEINIQIRNKLHKAKIVERPFYKYAGKK